ncbi:Wzz/FepE/Etk N-terminal domain-containing protein [Pseudomonas sp. AM8]|uniref:Wzz/FepE/Etk N-terminal domain-containing protein n=1 Tax=Pseudomonas sp. AM8 TaxID=2983368 RepID=UPI002E807949|nr:Wzz/FepE/Etk N-terminal domain-containing protein [Pseudomonas sp. AM8]
MSTSTNSNSRRTDDEIDLIPLIQALWTSKKILIATTVAGAIASYAIYATAPAQWTASTYLTKASLYSLYKEVKEKEPAPTAIPHSLETDLYSSIQNDVFYTAMGVMAAQAITLKEVPPKTGKNESFLYVASTTATTEESARTQLKSALDTANNEAMALNLPALASGKSVRAFNVLDEVKTVNNKNSKKLLALGAFLGFILGSFFVLGRLLTRQYKQPKRS